MSLRRITIFSVDLICRHWEVIFTNTRPTRSKIPRLSLRKESPGLCILPTSYYYYCTVCDLRSHSRKKKKILKYFHCHKSVQVELQNSEESIWQGHFLFFLINVYLSYRRDYGSFKYRKLRCINREKQLNISSMLFSSSCSKDVKIFQSL